MKRMNKVYFGGIYNGSLWEKILGVSAPNVWQFLIALNIVLTYTCNVGYPTSHFHLKFTGVYVI